MLALLSWCYGLALVELFGLPCWTVVCKRQRLFIQLSWGVFRYHAGSWKLEQILTLVESNIGDSHAWVSWMRVGTIGSFERLETWRIFTFVDQHSMSLEGGRISPQLAHLEVKDFLLIIRTRCCYALEFAGAWSLKLEIWRSHQQGHDTSNRSFKSVFR